MATSSPAKRLSRLDLPGVGLAGDHHVQAFAQQRALAGRRRDATRTRANTAREAFVQRRAREEIDLFVRKVDGGFDVDAKFRELRLQRADARRELASHGAHRGARRRRRCRHR